MTELLRELNKDLDVENLGKLPPEVEAAIDDFADRQDTLSPKERAKVIEGLGKIINAADDIATFRIPAETLDERK